MDDPRDLTLADMAALRDLDEEGDGDVLARLYDDTVNVRSVLPEVPADWTPGEAGEVIQVFMVCFLDRLERRSPMWRR